jgi:hypothetical protein
MLSREVTENLTFAKVFLAGWVFFTTVFFFLSISAPFILQKTQGELIANWVNNQLTTVYQNWQSIGYQWAIMQLGNALGKQLEDGCKEAVPVTFGSGISVGIVSTKCLGGEQWAPNTQAPDAGVPQQPTPQPQAVQPVPPIEQAPQAVPPQNNLPVENQ